MTTIVVEFYQVLGDKNNPTFKRIDDLTRVFQGRELDSVFDKAMKYIDRMKDKGYAYTWREISE